MIAALGQDAGVLHAFGPSMFFNPLRKGGRRGRTELGTGEHFNGIIYSVCLGHKLQSSGREWKLLLSKRKPPKIEPCSNRDSVPQ